MQSTAVAHSESELIPHAGLVSLPRFQSICMSRVFGACSCGCFPALSLEIKEH